MASNIDIAAKKLFPCKITALSSLSAIHVAIMHKLVAKNS